MTRWWKKKRKRKKKKTPLGKKDWTKAFLFSSIRCSAWEYDGISILELLNRTNFFSFTLRLSLVKMWIVKAPLT